MSELARIKQAMADGEHTDGDLAYAVEQWETAASKLDACQEFSQANQESALRELQAADREIESLTLRLGAVEHIASQYLTRGGAPDTLKVGLAKILDELRDVESLSPSRTAAPK